MIYILKTKSINKTDDSVQIRDVNFTLIGYFNFKNIDKALANCGLSDKKEIITKTIKTLKYGKIKKLEI